MQNLEKFLDKLDTLFFVHAEPDKERWEKQVAYGLALYASYSLSASMGFPGIVTSEAQDIAFL